jgi:hypothetical protein
MGTAPRSKAGRSAWREYHRRLLPVAILGNFLILVCFSFVALGVNGQLGFLAILLLFAYLMSTYVFWNRSLDAVGERWGASARGEVEADRGG